VQGTPRRSQLGSGPTAADINKPKMRKHAHTSRRPLVGQATRSQAGLLALSVDLLDD
jgi:hypothetical protein